MDEAELDEILTGIEAELQVIVAEALDEVAAEFAAEVESADELVAARFSVSRIAGMWRRQVGRIMDRLRGVTEQAAETLADELGTDLPPEWDEALEGYVESTQRLLDEVGTHLSEAAVRTLAQGLNDGDSPDQLRSRLLAAFATDGTQLGPTRAQRIASTEATRAWNAGTLAAAEALTGPDRPLVKQWITRRDTKVRPAHAAADGQLRLLGEPFNIGGHEMQYPGDPSAPANQTIECRCVLRTAAARSDADEGTASMATSETVDKITAAVQTGAMIALVPSAADADYLAVPEGEPAHELHVTLAYLGEAAGWDSEHREILAYRMSALAEELSVLDARLFGVACWNPSENPVWVWSVGDGEATPDGLASAHAGAWYGLDGLGPVPTPHTPFAAHMTGAYGLDEGRMGQLASRLGNITFDRLRVAFGGEVTDYLLTGGSGVADDTTPADVGELQSQMPSQLKRYWLAGPGAAKIRWGTPGSFDRCVRALRDDFPENTEGLCANLYHEATGRWPGQNSLSLAYDEPAEATPAPEPPALVLWSTPGDSALAFENQQTGDGRVFAPGALYWNGAGPWPLQYADEMNGGHDGARLAGSIDIIGRDGDRITGQGCIYMSTSAGVDAAMMLSQGAPLGVSVDLDDVDMELVDQTSGEAYTASFVTASLLPLDGGGFAMSAETVATWTSASASLVSEASRMTFTVGTDGCVPAAAFELTAAAGDPGLDGTVVEVQRSGDYLMRITRARLRGATLVTIPAYDRARIVLDDVGGYDQAASAEPEITADAANKDFDRVIRHVRKSLNPVTVAGVAGFLGLNATVVRRHLARAAKEGKIMRISRGRYVGMTGDVAVPDAGVAPTPVTVTADATPVAEWDVLSAAVTGAVDLPVADRDAEWDGAAAESRVFEWADGDANKISQAFAYRDDEADPLTKGAYKLGYADVEDGRLVIIPAGVFAAQAALMGARGGTDIPTDQVAAVRDRLEAVRAHVEEVTGTEDREDMEASAWTAMQDLPAMPSAWFAEPTSTELPPGGPGVNYANGRIFGWVAQAGEPHAGMAKKVTIDTLGRIDTTHFLRQRFTLDDGSSVKAGAFTMGVGHHRDGAECETASCQFDSTRTVAGIVTVGMNSRGMWFSGAAAPWLAEWDRSVFMASQPSYHMRKGANGNWQLRAVLSVPVPGHSSPLLASAVIERSNLALTAAATMFEVEEAVAAATVVADEPDPIAGLDYDRLADAMVASLARAETRRKEESAELEALLAEASSLDL